MCLSRAGNFCTFCKYDKIVNLNTQKNSVCVNSSRTLGKCKIKT